MDEVIYLQISTFIGMSFGARHYYGELVGDYSNNERHSIELKYQLSQEQATNLNDQDREYGSFIFAHRVGQFYTGFDTRDEIIALAIKTWKQHFQNGKILILGRAILAEPQAILDCDNQKDYEYLNHIYKLFKGTGGWEKKSKNCEAKAIWDLWNEKFSEYSGIKYR